jgi:hypothetical protein
MDRTRLVVIEDSSKAHIIINELFGEDGISPAVPNLQLDRQVSLPFTQRLPEERRAELDKVLTGIESCQGPMVLALDMDLTLAEESGKIRSDLRSDTERVLGKEIPGDLLRQVDGLRIAVEVIAQKRIKPLVVAVLTAKGGNEEIEFILNEFAKSQDREHEVKILRGNVLVNRVLSSNQADATYVTCLLNDIDEEFQAAFGGQLTRFFQLLDKGGNGDTTHNNLGSKPKETVTSLLTVLLDLPEEEFIDQIWAPWQQCPTELVTETVKAMGIGERDRLTATAGWFFALAAFRHSKDPRDWREVFNINHLTQPCLENTEYLTPPQSEVTLRRSIVCFYDMCRLLFKSEDFKDGDLQPGPLVAVTLSPDEGLRMRLSFDCAPRAETRKRQSLYEQVGRWRNNSGGWQPMNTAFDARVTSQAVWRFWLATSVGDKPLPDPDRGGTAGVFGSKRLWRMNIFRRPAGCSEVVFNDK